MKNKKILPLTQTTLSNASKLQKYLQAYYSIMWIRIIINFIYILNQVLLALYLLFIPIQIAYYWLLSNGENSDIQTYIDISVLILFIVHVLLYMDERFYEIMKNPYAIIWKKIITVQLIYDLLTVFLAIYAVAAVKKSIGQRAVQIIFVLKIYKLIKFDRKAMYFVIGTQFYIFYKVIRTLLIVFMAIAFIGSLFYGVAYILYYHNINVDMLWIYSCSAINDCVAQPFIIQLQYAMYWALGTASTAAYGDISATEPTVMIVNILALAFQGFLFGFYLNSMHSIPLQNQQKQSDLLQKFDSFQQHSSNRKLDDKLYLQILCSLEYTQSQKRSLESIQKVMPKKYIQQIKYNIYSQFLNKREYFCVNAKNQYAINVQLSNHNLFSISTQDLLKSRQKQLLFGLTDIVVQTICQINQDVYDYKNVNYDHILFVKQGQVNYSISSQKEHPNGLSDTLVTAGQCFGLYSFYTGLNIPTTAICSSYSIIYSIGRNQFKGLLTKAEKIQFYKKYKRSVIFEQPQLLKQPIMKFMQALQINNSNAIQINFKRKYEKIRQILDVKLDKRVKFRRQNIKTQKIIRKKSTNKRNQETQTEILFENDPINFIDSYDSLIDQNIINFDKSISIGKSDRKIDYTDKKQGKKIETFMISMQ